MPRTLAHIALLVRDYDEAIRFYVDKLAFTVLEDSEQPAEGKRWVIVSPDGSGTCSILLARAATPHQVRHVGDQAAGRVFLFLRTDDFWRDYRAFVEKGVVFVRPPKVADYGIVAVFRDLYGNLWDLVQFTDGRV